MYFPIFFIIIIFSTIMLGGIPFGINQAENPGRLISQVITNPSPNPDSKSLQAGYINVKSTFEPNTDSSGFPNLDEINKIKQLVIDIGKVCPTEGGTMPHVTIENQACLDNLPLQYTNPPSVIQALHESIADRVLQCGGFVRASSYLTKHPLSLNGGAAAYDNPDIAPTLLKQGYTWIQYMTDDASCNKATYLSISLRAQPGDLAVFNRNGETHIATVIEGGLDTFRIAQGNVWEGDVGGGVNIGLSYYSECQLSVLVRPLP